MNSFVEATVVVHLHEVLNHDLPVEWDVVHHLWRNGDEVVDVVVRQHCLQFVEARRKGRCVE